jgi:iron complex transport system ATP-binding protein
MSNKLEIMRIINYLAKEKAKTILFTSHDLGLGLTVADKLWLIKENRLETGFTEDLANRQDILDYFAGASVRFDYRSNEYEFTSERTKKEVTLTGSSRSLYWLRKALIRNRFSINEGTDFLISEKDSVFVIKHSGKEYFFSAIEEVIRFLSA